MSNELKPCPFCGGRAYSNTGFYDSKCTISCGDCEIDFQHESYTVLESAWNRRVIPTAEVLPVEASQLDELEESRQSVEYKINRIILDMQESIISATMEAHGKINKLIEHEEASDEGNN